MKMKQQKLTELNIDVLKQKEKKFRFLLNLLTGLGILLFILVIVTITKKQVTATQIVLLSEVPVFLHCKRYHTDILSEINAREDYENRNT
jgi:hypothetical protein